MSEKHNNHPERPRTLTRLGRKVSAFVIGLSMGLGGMIGAASADTGDAFSRMQAACAAEKAIDQACTDAAINLLSESDFIDTNKTNKIQAYQGVNGLDRTGKIGKQTRARLLSGSGLNIRVPVGATADLKDQVLAVNDGKKTVVMAISSGSGKSREWKDQNGNTVEGKAITPTGQFKIYDKRPDQISPETPNATEPNMIKPSYLSAKDEKGNYRGLAIHGTTPAHLEELSQEASNGCLRIDASNADKVSSMLPMKSKVNIVADFDFLPNLDETNNQSTQRKPLPDKPTDTAPANVVIPANTISPVTPNTSIPAKIEVAQPTGVVAVGNGPITKVS